MIRKLLVQPLDGVQPFASSSGRARFEPVDTASTAMAAVSIASERT